MVTTTYEPPALQVFLRESLELMPHDVELWLLMGILYSKMGRGRDVRQALKQAKQVERSDNFSERYYHLAVRCLKVPLPKPHCLVTVVTPRCSSARPITSQQSRLERLTQNIAIATMFFS